MGIFIIASFIQLPSRIGYPVLFALIAVESAGVPLPGETALIGAGLLAHKGDFNVIAVIAVAASAAIIGDNIGYMIGRTGGRWMLERPGFMEKQRHRILKRGEPFFKRHGAKAVFLGRWVSGLRIWASWLAGITHMPWHTFLFWNAAGGILWATAVTLLAYFAGPVAEQIFHFFGIAGLCVAITAVIGLLVWHFLHKRKRSREF